MVGGKKYWFELPGVPVRKRRACQCSRICKDQVTIHILQSHYSVLVTASKQYEWREAALGSTSRPTNTEGWHGIIVSMCCKTQLLGYYI